MIFPPFLQAGDRVGLVAPASSIKPEQTEAALAQLQHWGFEAVLSPRLFEQFHGFAGCAELRLEALQEMLDDTSLKAIFCVRGGYGCVQIIDQLDFSAFAAAPKWLVGFSDITVLLQKIHCLGIACIHGEMPIRWGTCSPESLSSLQKALQGEAYQLVAPPHEANRTGACSATAIALNLCLFHHQIGTNTDIDTEGKILILEDVGEPLYNIERMFYHLKRAGKLSHLAGLALGSFSGIRSENPPFGKEVWEMVQDLCQDESYPIAFDLPIGHEADNQAIVCGAEARLEVGTQGTTLRFPKL
jgi:muramoyltetrapeptide carboxypeptidase